MEKNEGKARLEISDLLEKIRDKLGKNDRDLFITKMYKMSLYLSNQN